ncbi:MAG: phosphosulfolactate synthase [Flavobacteriales bacterium TMED191]|nr:MAG: phosphosulfolactate synthase [Flavobacteriales bacterium TMED191]|tara:strand:- start:2129 stop:2887 length:759 start_codon:yes stop_codon:yes gene_type:complete
MIDLPNIPIRPDKPRQKGLTMVMDKGISTLEAEGLMETCSSYIDIIKFGFGTSLISKNISKKIKLYKKHGIKLYLGGTLFEAYIVRNMFKEYCDLVNNLELNTVEISDGSIEMNHNQKCEYINKLANQNITVFSEVGYKSSDKIIAPSKWIELMEKELKAGSWKVIAEARESGNVGLYRSSGEVRSDLIEEILTKIPKEKILWEAPKKQQQVFFIKLLGPNVNLGNIGTNDIIPLESLRLGLRGDTFFNFIK